MIQRFFFILGVWLILSPAPRLAAQSLDAFPQIRLEPIVSGLSRPIAATHAGDGSGRLFITLQGGQILIYDGTQVLSEPFLDINTLISCCGEQGLLSVAFHPNYDENGFFYVNYTNVNGDTVVERYTVSVNDPNRADPNSGVEILNVDQLDDETNHNGGQLQFGPLDGYLYIGMGDGGGSGDTGNFAQNPQSLLGKMLRIDVDNGVPYAIPETNPFVEDSEVLDEIWGLGLRNPWRFSFDRMTGDLFIADVGQNAFEEVDFQPAASTGKENYGWRKMEGFECFNPSTQCMEVDHGILTLPILAYDHDVGRSITGGYRYRGTALPQLAGKYLFGDFIGGQIWGAEPDSQGVWSFPLLLNTGFSVSAFGEDENGELYVFQYSFGSSGVLHKIRSGITLDIDGNGDTTSIDGLLLLRYMFGLRGIVLWQGISNVCQASPASCTTVLEERLSQAVMTYGDVDGNGQRHVMQDGLLLLRYLLGLRGDALIRGVVNPAGTRTTAQAIENFLENFFLPQS